MSTGMSVLENKYNMTVLQLLSYMCTCIVDFLI